MEHKPSKATIESLPDELILKIVKEAAVSDKVQGYRFWTRSSTLCPSCGRGTCSFDHDFVVNVLSEISTKFNRIARDASLWREDRDPIQ